MRAFARGLCGDMTAAEDLAQDGLLEGLDGPGQYQPGTNLKACVFTIMRNQFYSERRRAWRNVALDQTDGRGDPRRDLQSRRHDRTGRAAARNAAAA